MSSKPQVRTYVALTLLVLGACAPDEKRTATEITTTTEALISDAAHGGAAGFYFLPPMVDKPRFTGVFDRFATPVVQIDQINAQGAVVRPVVTFTMTTGRGGARIKRGNKAYKVRWKTRDFDLNPNAVYRINVLNNNRRIGFADVAIAEDRREFKNINENLFIPLMEDDSLLIRFRIEGGVEPPPPAPDGDGDTIIDADDNCPTVANRDQRDTNGDDVGDACECLGLVCDAPSACHTSTCDSTIGECVDTQRSNGASCSDGNACNGAETCTAGVCGAGQTLTCADNNPCTLDSCAPSTGCVFTAAPNGPFAGSTPTACGLGACAATGQTVCMNGGVANSCAPGAPAADDASCNAIDDDCDGIVDEEYAPAVTTCGVGACGREGSTFCLAGLEGDTCTPGAPAADDAACDGIDADCNGAIDEDYVALATTCGVGECFREGATACIAGGVVDQCSPGAPAALDETCNGLDDDCNGASDEDYVSEATRCGEDVCTYAGASSCFGGAIDDGCGTVYECPAYPHLLSALKVAHPLSDVGTRKQLTLRFTADVREGLRAVGDTDRFVNNIVGLRYADDIVATEVMIAELASVRIEHCGLAREIDRAAHASAWEVFICDVNSSLAIENLVAFLKTPEGTPEPVTVASDAFTFVGDTCREPGCIDANVGPIFECLEVLEGKSFPGTTYALPRYVAHFGYINRTGATLTIASGADNAITGATVAPPAEWLAKPAAGKLSLPTVFEPGRQVFKFTVPLDEPNATWKIGGRTAVVTPQSARCDGTRPARN